MTQFRPMIGENDMDFLGATAFNRGVAEEIEFETVMAPASPAPGGIVDRTSIRLSTQPLPVDEGIAILQPPDRSQGKLPGFGYWFLVTLAAISAFWISGGHVLFSR